jgi:hypothetical protein
MTTRPTIAVLLLGSCMRLLPKQRRHRQVVVDGPGRAQLPGKAKRAPSITTRLMPWASR